MTATADPAEPTPQTPPASEPETAPPAWLSTAMVVVALVAVVAAAAGVGVAATPGEHLGVDEPQYWFSALSLAEDADLDISDELAERRWEQFTDVAPPVETMVLDGGRQISPHDPLLALLLALPVAMGGWVAAKLTLALLAGALAALTLWTAVRRFAVPLGPAAAGVGLAAASAPLAVYGQQLYPELPAALVCLLGLAALTGPARRPQLVLLAVSVVALPWLSVKYVPVAGVLAGLAALRWWRAGRRAEVCALGAALAGAAATYLAVHRAVWGGWTVYASGDHFADIGEFAVVGVDPDYPGRAWRLVGLLVDRDFGLAAWQPGWLLIVPAVAALLACPPRGGRATFLVAPLLAGWLVATFLALTMHGWWWPGRQTVIVLPLALLAVLCWLARSGTAVRAVAALLGLAGVSTYVALLIDGYAGQAVWVSHTHPTGYSEVDAPGYQLLRPLLPVFGDNLGHLAWAVLLALLALRAVAAGRGARRPAAKAAAMR